MKLLLLFAPCVVALWAPLYNTETPALLACPSSTGFSFC